MKHNSPSNQATAMADTKFPTQQGSNQNSRFLNGKRPYSPWNQGKSNQASNSTKDANSLWRRERKVSSIELRQTSRQAYAT
jgi:hypothetical protein